MELKRLPKVELHLHLDCSLSYKAVARLTPGVSREEYLRDFIAPARCTNLADFLLHAPRGFRLMQSEEALRVVTEDVIEQLVDDGVAYAELRFAPLLHLEKGLSAERVVAVVERAAEDLTCATGIEVRLILCTLRHFNAEQSMQTAQLVEQFCGSRVAALDIAGDEAGFPLDAHLAAYQFAREHGLQRTAHAGEACGPESVWETLRMLNPQRIGHGTRSIEDAQLVDHLRREKIHLELCPSSNVQIIPSIAKWEEHPIDRLYRAGVSLSLNTDTRMLNPVTLTGEYLEMRRVFGWGEADFLRTNLMGVEAAFADDSVKERVRKRLTESYEAIVSNG
ncbi:MAG TPA: adenosine deaminase [Terracidiphilus sp.]|nr:adenosine deaminase [Terracidiphilus sp.]